jgi:hypothetical protein
VQPWWNGGVSQHFVDNSIAVCGTTCCFTTDHLILRS